MSAVPVPPLASCWEENACRSLRCTQPCGPPESEAWELLAEAVLAIGTTIKHPLNHLHLGSLRRGPKCLCPLRGRKHCWLVPSPPNSKASSLIELYTRSAPPSCYLGMSQPVEKSQRFSYHSTRDSCHTTPVTWLVRQQRPDCDCYNHHYAHSRALCIWCPLLDTHFDCLQSSFLWLTRRLCNGNVRLFRSQASCNELAADK